MWRELCVVVVTVGVGCSAECKDEHCESTALYQDNVLLQTSGGILRSQQSGPAQEDSNEKAHVEIGHTKEIEDPLELVGINATEEDFLLRNRPSNKEMEHFRLIKAVRAQGHRCPDGTYYPPYNGPLEWDCRLWRAARGWSNRMATEGFEGHRYGGSTACKRTEAAGYPKGKGCGENLALGDGNPATAIQQLNDSNDHCKNMMDPAYNMVGVGLIHKSGSRFRYYWTDSFGAYHRRPDQSCIGGSPAPQLPPGCADIDLHNCGLYKKQGQC